MKRLLTYLSAIIIMMMVPIGMQAVNDIYLIGSTLNGGNWNAKGSHKFTYDSGTNQATLTLPAATLNGGTDNNTVYLALWVDQGGTTGYRLRPSSTTVLAFGSGSLQVKSDYNNENTSVQLNSVSNSSDKEYVITLSNCSFSTNSPNDLSSCDVSIVENTVATTTATLTIGGNDIAGTNSGSNYYFTIPAASYTAGSDMSFTLKTETGGTATYYTGNFAGSASGDNYVCSTSTSSGTMLYTVPSNASGPITVTLNVDEPRVTFAYQTSGGGGTSTGYYLVGDLNAFGRAYNDIDWDTKDWGTYGSVNKVLKFTDKGDGTYSLRIPAAHQATSTSEWDKPQNEKDSGVSHEFVIAPESAFSGTEYSGDLYTVGDDDAWKSAWELNLDWNQVLRPTSNKTLDNAASSGSMAAGGSDKWVAKMNGGSYTITINPTAGTFSVTNDNTTHVMYVLTKQGGYWRASYLTDVTTSESTAYDHDHGNNASSGELSQFPNESGSTVYIAHNWYQVDDQSQKNFNTKEHLTIFGAWNDNGDLAPVTWIAAKSSATAQSIFPTAGNYSTNMDPTRGRTDGVSGTTIYSSQRILTNSNDPSTGNITGKKGDAALIDPDATLSPGTTTWDNYTKNELKALTVTMNSHATGYKYSFGAASTPNTAGTSTTFGNLSYDGTNVKLGDDVVASGTNTVTIRIQGTKDTSEGAIHDYTYTFNVPVVSNLDFTPKGGFFINKAVITVTNGTAPYTYTIKDASNNVLSTGTSSTATFTISTPGKLTVTDKNGKSATSSEKFDFTYSTSENYANYYNNGTTAQSVAQEGGADATNIFLKKADYKNMRIYAWDDTYDQLIQTYQKGETTSIDSELSALGLTRSSESNWKDIWQDNKFIRSEQGTGDGYTHTYNDTRAGFLERDAQVMLTEAYPGTLMSDSRSIKIDGEEYYYLTLPLNRLHFANSQVGIIVTRNDDSYTDLGKNADKYKTADRVISSNSSFIYSSVQNGENYNNSIVDISDAVAGTNVVFYKNTSNWSNVKIYLYNSESDKKTSWNDAPAMKKFDGDIYYYALSNTETWSYVIFRDGGTNQTNNLNYGGGRKMYVGQPATGNTGTVQAGNADYITYINKPSTYTVEVQNHPNGDDYLRAMPSDKTVLLDPTWGGVITPKEVADEETSVPSWNGVEGNTVGYRKIVTQNLTQTIYGLDNSKTYTVQAIVRVWDGKTVTLKVGDGTAVSSAAWGASGIAHVNKNGRVDERYTAGPDPDDPYFLHVGGNTAQGYGWQKIEASGNPTKAGNLVITLTNSDNTQQYDLADVVLLENANTAGNYWTKLPTDETSVAAIKAGEIDMTERDTYNAFSFFDRDSGNPNAMIKASNRTVIGLQSGIADGGSDTVDHRQSRNTISLNEDGTTWSGRYLYLYDESSDWSDCNAYGASVDFNMIGAKYDRQFTANQHSTLFLPFAVTTEQLKTAGFKELQMVDVDNVTSANIPLITWDLTKEPLTSYTTTAGQGYIVIAGSNGASLSSFIKPTVGINVQAANSAYAMKTETTGLVGAYVYCKRNQTEEVGGTTYMNYSYLNDKFRALATAAQGGAEIKPFRATFAVPNSVVNGARTLPVSFIDAEDAFTPTGVDKLGVEEQLSGNIYTLDGRLVSTNGKLSELSRGIYVRGGRKIVVK